MRRIETRQSEDNGINPQQARSLRWAKRTAMLQETEHLQDAEKIVRQEGLAGIVRRRIRLARKDHDFQRFLGDLLA